ncbi:integral membrane protein [Kroppenstedtia sanguinis]
MNTPLGRFRVVSLIEGLSFLVLLGIAMPLKYFADITTAVTLVGWIHGVLFVLYIAAVAHVTLTDGWSLIRVAGALIASLLPFGPFVFDARLRRERKW